MKKIWFQKWRLMRNFSKWIWNLQRKRFQIRFQNFVDCFSLIFLQMKRLNISESKHFDSDDFNEYIQERRISPLNERKNERMSRKKAIHVKSTVWIRENVRRKWNALYANENIWSKKRSTDQLSIIIKLIFTASKAKDFVTAIEIAIEAIKASKRKSIRTANGATATTKKRTTSTNRISATSNAVDRATVIFIWWNFILNFFSTFKIISFQNIRKSRSRFI